MYKVSNGSKEELKGKTVTKFLVRLDNCHRNISSYSEYLCEYEKLRLVLIVELQSIYTEDETTSITIKSCNENATISTKINYCTKSRSSGVVELINIIDMNEDKYAPVLKSSKLYINSLEITIITRKNDESKIYNLFFDDTTMAEDYQALMNNKDSSDVTVVVGDKQFSCHKIILSTRSPVFARMFEADMLEKQSGQVTVEDVTSKTFGLLLKYIYTGRLDETEMKKMEIDWVELMLAAEKYDINGLKKVCWKNITGNLSVDNAIEAFILADRLNLPELKELTAAFILENRNKVVDTEKYKELVKNHNDLALELFELILKSKVCKE